MNEDEFKKLVKKDRYQVFLFISRIPFPWFFAVHSWFIISNKGKVSRWESGMFRGKAQKSWGNVHFNMYNGNPLTGMNINPFKSGPRYKSKLIDFIEGKENSVAYKMIKFLEKDARNYPYKKEYKLRGPNSNTFTQWVLNNFKESKFKLPGNAFGKQYSK